MTLTSREQRLVHALLAGGTNRDVAKRVGLKEQTVKNQLSAIYEKFGIRNRLELAMYFTRHRIVQEPANE